METLQKIYFVSGHINLSQAEFETHYLPQMQEAIKNNCKIITSDSNGCDAMAQQFLKDQNYANVTIYHMFEAPRVNLHFYPCVGGFTSHTQRDACMTRDSTHDIAWVRPEHETRELVLAEGKTYRPGRISGTEQNILRRKKIF